jgi:hypothetical protein
MLIKLAGHFPNNPNHIDKLISIKGLPEEWLFRNGPHGKELAKPWMIDNEDTIPKAIRHLCEPTDVVVVYSPIAKGEQGVVDKKTLLGIKLDYGTEPGREMWEKIERYLDRMTPRDRKVPEPVMMAPNHKSDFNPTIGRRSVRGSMEFASNVEVPDVDLRATVEEAVPVPKVVPAPVIVAPVVEKKEEVDARSTVKARCEECKLDFKSKGIYAIHMKKHKVKEKVGV